MLEAYDADHAEEVITSNGSVPDWLDGAAVERIIEYARGRADARGEQSALDQSETECVIATNWHTFTDDWGYSGGAANQIAVGVFNAEVSSGKQADLFTDTTDTVAA